MQIYIKIVRFSQKSLKIYHFLVNSVLKLGFIGYIIIP